ncbi:GTP-binding protein [uncultured Clostridium sp.]|uniref:GTP-binding protein n=1 Tax=uncultured Clostridium sp. TaxID=59620 RepID=UPI0025FA3604|nr:GTP-binding protein [uncultured Clostridium sp.]
MSIKLSELKNDDMLLVGENLIISKEDYVNEIQEHRGEEVYTTTKYIVGIDARRMLEDAIECEADMMYEDWEDDVWHDIAEEDIEEIQNILDKILSRSRNISYIIDKKVEVDIEINKCACSKYGKSLQSGIKCSNCGREL